jgi:hypothetical protein
MAIARFEAARMQRNRLFRPSAGGVDEGSRRVDDAVVAATARFEINEGSPAMKLLTTFTAAILTLGMLSITGCEPGDQPGEPPPQQQPAPPDRERDIDRQRGLEQQEMERQRQEEERQPGQQPGEPGEPGTGPGADLGTDTESDIG